jgi:hypothetical protein
MESISLKIWKTFIGSTTGRSLFNDSPIKGISNNGRN